MNFQKNQFFKVEPTKIAGNKVLSKNNPFDISKQFINQNQTKLYKEQPLTPGERLKQQQNQTHFMSQKPFQK